jgi:hypothetical protein
VEFREIDERAGGLVFLPARLCTNDAVGNVPMLSWAETVDDVLVAALMQDVISLPVLIQKLSATG